MWCLWYEFGDLRLSHSNRIGNVILDCIRNQGAHLIFLLSVTIRFLIIFRRKGFLVRMQIFPISSVLPFNDCRVAFVILVFDLGSGDADVICSGNIVETSGPGDIIILILLTVYNGIS